MKRLIPIPHVHQPYHCFKVNQSILSISRNETSFWVKSDFNMINMLTEVEIKLMLQKVFYNFYSCVSLFITSVFKWSFQIPILSTLDISEPSLNFVYTESMFVESVACTYIKRYGTYHHSHSPTTIIHWNNHWNYIAYLLEFLFFFF